jgi:60 kDa SS-A/Ro ribonucleoprotein
MNVGGFSDAVFSMLALFAEGRMDGQHWVGEIEKLPLEMQ